MKWTSIVCGAVLATMGLATNASAVGIAGELNISGSVTLQALPGANFTLDFFPTGGGAGTFNTNVPDTGYFAGIFCGNPPFCGGTEKDVASTPTVGFSTITPGGATSVSNFLDFSTPASLTPPGFGTLGFDLTFVPISTAPICTGLEGLNVPCRPSALSPFTLENTSNGAEVDFGVDGNFHAHAGADSGRGIGTYTTQLTGQTIQNILTTLAAGGSFSASYSANFIATSAVPEPITLLTFGAGSLLALRRRRRQTQA